MDGKASIYTEKKLAYYEASYKTSVIAKPQEVNLTLTAAHIYGVGYMCQQNGTQEDDPIYTRFSCGLDEITKVYINENVKSSPLYIQCDFPNKGVINRKRIIIPCLDHVTKIVEAILDAKMELDQKIESKKKMEYDQKLKKIESEKALDKTKYPEKEDPINKIDDFFKDIDNRRKKVAEPSAPVAEPVAEPVEEAEPVKQPEPEVPAPEKPKERTLPPIVNPFDYDEKIDKKNLSDSLKSIRSKKSVIENANPIKDVVNKAQSAAKAASKAQNSIDVDDVISEILDNLQTKVGFGNNDETERSSDYDELKAENETENQSPVTDEEEIGTIKATEPVILENLSFDTVPEISEPSEPSQPLEKEDEIQEEIQKKPIEYASIIEPEELNHQNAEEIEEVEEVKIEEPEQSHEDILNYTPKETIKLEEFEASVRQLKNLLDNDVITQDKFNIEKKKLVAKLY